MVNESSTKKISVELAYALPDVQALLKIDIQAGATVQQAIEQSGLLRQFPQINLAQDKVGVFSKVCKLDRVLSQGDRIEIYRPLLIDPKQRRREKAEKAKQERNKKAPESNSDAS